MLWSIKEESFELGSIKEESKGESIITTVWGLADSELESGKEEKFML